MSKVRKAVITAAGRGTRQYPASTAVAKEMFTLVDRDGMTKPVIQIIAEECIDSGIEQICIVTQPGGETLFRKYFRRLSTEQATHFRGKDWALLESEKLSSIGSMLSFAEQHSPEGFGHAVYQAKKFARGEPVLLLLGDHVYVSETKDRCARQLIRVFEGNDVSAVTGVQVTKESELPLFGTIRGIPITGQPGAYKAELIVEKPSAEAARRQLTTAGLPAQNYLCHFGIHVFGNQIFDSLEYLINNDLRQNDEIQMTAAQEHLRQQTDKYWVSITRGQRYDTGIPYGLMETQLGLGLNGVDRKQLCEAIARIFGTQRQG